MTNQETLASFAKHHKVGLHINSKNSLRISLFARGVCLAEFDNFKAALNWFPIN